MGLLRIEDVAIGCLVSLVVGVLFWPRGAASVVGDDLADAFRRGAADLTQAVDGLEEGGDLVRVITTPQHPHLLWVQEHLQHLGSHASAIAGPASRVAEQRRVPWWR